MQSRYSLQSTDIKYNGLSIIWSETLFLIIVMNVFFVYTKCTSTVYNVYVTVNYVIPENIMLFDVR